MGYSTLSISPPGRKWVPTFSVPSILFGSLLTVFFYFLLWILPLSGLRAFFLERGIIQPVTSAVFMTVAIYCGIRHFQIRKERRSAKKKWLLDSDDYAINANQSLRESIRLLGKSSSVVANRQERVLSFFVNSKSRQIARELSQDDALATNTDIENAYAVVRIMIWSMPMLGFLGTVLGISVSISGFSGLLSGVSDLSAVKLGLTQVTSGLSTAFDTTLLGIVCAILCTFGASICERNEHRLAQTIDEIVNDDLLPRLS